MKIIVAVFFILFTQVNAFDLKSIETFVASSVVPENAKLLGFQSTDEIQRLKIGPPYHSLGDKQ